MTSTYFLDPVPLWLLYLISAAVVLLSIELGWRLGNLLGELHTHQSDEFRLRANVLTNAEVLQQATAVAHPPLFQQWLVRSSSRCYPTFNLAMSRSCAFGSTPTA